MQISQRTYAGVVIGDDDLDEAIAEITRRKDEMTDSE
jgi:hypothetical protein